MRYKPTKLGKIVIIAILSMIIATIISKIINTNEMTALLLSTPLIFLLVNTIDHNSPSIGLLFCIIFIPITGLFFDGCFTDLQFICLSISLDAFYVLIVSGGN